jgi:hypothetical protein
VGSLEFPENENTINAEEFMSQSSCPEGGESLNFPDFRGFSGGFPGDWGPSNRMDFKTYRKPEENYSRIMNMATKRENFKISNSGKYKTYSEATRYHDGATEVSDREYEPGKTADKEEEDITDNLMETNGKANINRREYIRNYNQEIVGKERLDAEARYNNIDGSRPDIIETLKRKIPRTAAVSISSSKENFPWRSIAKSKR